MGWISEESRSLGAWAYEHAFPEMSTANFGENNHEYDSPADFSAKVQREAKDFDGFAFNDKRASIFLINHVKCDGFTKTNNAGEHCMDACPTCDVCFEHVERSS
jgi:hypothetical protein